MSSDRDTPMSSADHRRALGHFPTGVTVITAREADGEPVSVVIGSFVSVSLDPRLVGFFIGRDSSSWARIRATGAFGVSVLSGAQELVCRAFATRSPERFYLLEGEHSTIPRVRDAVLWIECDIESVVPAGDHDFVLGRVTTVEVSEDPGLPLVFVRGGYGAPTIASLQVERPGLGLQLRWADAVRPYLEALAAELQRECVLTAAVGEEVVVLTAAGVGAGSGMNDTYVGATFPLAAPLAPLFVAWADDATRRRWKEAGTRLAGIDVTAVAEAELSNARQAGLTVTTGRGRSDTFETAIRTGHGADAATASVRDLLDEGSQSDSADRRGDVTSITAPVRTDSGDVVLCLTLLGFHGNERVSTIEECQQRLQDTAARAGSALDELLLASESVEKR